MDVPTAEVEDLLSALAKSLRAHQMYQVNNPVYRRFIDALASAFTALWRRTSSLQLTVDESTFRWEGGAAAPGDGRDNLAFLFHKDGIRYLTFLPGFEEEIERFLDVVHRARQHEGEADDLITLLWEEEFAGFRYGYVDQLAEGLAMPGASGGVQRPVSLGEALEEVRSEAVAVAPVQEAGAPAATVSPDDFDEALFLLEEDEMRRLQAEVDREWKRDLKGEVLNALFDRLEDPDPERQDEILAILRQLLPNVLTRGDLVSASTILLELNTLVTRGDVLAEEQEAAVQRLFHELSEPALLEQLVHALEDGTIDPDATELGVFLSHLRPEALPLLIRVIEITEVPGVRDRLRTAIEGIAREHAHVLLELLDSKEPVVTAGAARVAGRLELADAVEPLSRVLERPEPDVRLAAIEALTALHSSEALEALGRALRDGDRDVRMAAARGLGALRYRPAAPRLQTVLEGRTIRDADLTEKIAFFEAYGAVGGADSVVLLDQFLNGKRRFGRRPTPEIRACAALALGKVATPAARAALERAGPDPDPIVRTAVARALRQEEVAS